MQEDKSQRAEEVPRLQEDSSQRAEEQILTRNDKNIGMCKSTFQVKIPKELICVRTEEQKIWLDFFHTYIILCNKKMK